MQIRLTDLTFGYTDPLFEHVTLSIGDNDRIGIVGNNGSGKSTLLKCITGQVEPNKGTISYPRGTTFGYMEQDVPKELMDSNLYDVLVSAIPPDERDYSSWKVDIALDTFKAPEDIRHKPIKELSGGWQRLALVARVALSEPDVLILDEPTNHLDVAKILVLEQWLNEQIQGTPLITVSHDRNFLTNCTNKTFFLRGTTVHEFGYSYERAKELLQENDKATAALREKGLKEKDRLERQSHNLRQLGKDNRSGLLLRKSIQLANRAEKLEEEIPEVHVEARRDIKLNSSELQSKNLIEIKDVTIKAPDGAELFHIDKFRLAQGERVVILGPNGSGKSQFLQHLLKAFGDTDEARNRGIAITPSVKLGYIDQHMSNLPKGMSVHDYINHEFKIDRQATIRSLVNAGFPMVDQNQKIGSLSQGQQARIVLLGLQLTKPNFYIMDEPTNHLDIAGQEQLESEILEHQAASLLVSHDRTFVQNIGTKFFVISNKKLVPIENPEEYYQVLSAADNIETAGRNFNYKKKFMTYDR